MNQNQHVKPEEISDGKAHTPKIHCVNTRTQKHTHKRRTIMLKSIFKISVTFAVLLLSGMLVNSHSGRTDNTADTMTESTAATTTKEEKPKAQNGRFKVHVNVSCSDNTTKSMIESHIKRELRSLGDVDIVDEKHNGFRLILLAIPHTSKSTEKKTGQTSIAIMELYKEGDLHAFISSAISLYATTIEPNYRNLPDKEFLKRKTKRFEIAKEWSESLGDVYNRPGLELIVNIPNNNLPATCKEIVAEFDVKHLEPFREITMKILENKN